MRDEFKDDSTAVSYIDEALAAAQRRDGPEMVKALSEMIKKKPRIKDFIMNNMRKGLDTARLQVGKEMASAVVIGGLTAIFRILLPV